MANEEQLNILKQGVKTWNKWRKENPDIKIDLSKADLREVNLSGVWLHDVDLSGVNLSGANLNGANLSEAYLRWANLSEAYLRGANLRGGNLSEANLSETILRRANLSEANLRWANLSEANLSDANLNDANLRGAKLSDANLSDANLSGANLHGANLCSAHLTSAKLSKAIFQKTRFGMTTLVNIDLSDTRDLLTVKHERPSSIGTDTLVKSKGKIPTEFLRQCGLSPWEIELARLYDPALTPAEISDIISTDLFQKRTKGPLFIGGIFISYSHEDSKFVDKVYELLKEEGAAVWLDRHDMEAGSIQKQVTDQIRIMDILLIVLSKASIISDWVENELEQARKKEKKESRSIICPVALDDTWKSKIEGDQLWRQVAKYNILNFSEWENEDSFNKQFQKLVSGIKKNYTIFYK